MLLFLLSFLRYQHGQRHTSPLHCCPPLIYTVSVVLLTAHVGHISCGGILYPHQSESRQVFPLDGIWSFVVSNPNRPLQGFEERWYKKQFHDLSNVEVLQMPVPSSYNDVTTDWRIRDHVGLVWYQRNFYVAKQAQQGRVWLRFGSVSYAAEVWVNGQLMVRHEIGHLPFVTEITGVVAYGKENYITVACDNTLLNDTIPQGRLAFLSNQRIVQTYTFDFFNYAGIDRSVLIYTTPAAYIDDITVHTDIDPIDATTGIIYYDLTYSTDDNDDSSNFTCAVHLLDRQKQIVATDDSSHTTGVFYIHNAHLWWPRLMHSDPGYLYTLQVELLSANGKVVDVYRQPVGIRTISWTNRTLSINDRPIYLHGFGKHEDFDVKGKGVDLAVMVRDYNLIDWIGANAFRTSHYPYSEEMMDMADQLGIMVIDECPSVNTEFFSESLLLKHKRSLTELIQRDKNRPSVIMWSAANEPRTQFATAKEYFRQVIAHIKDLDTSRPTTIVEAQAANVVMSSDFVDVISFNRYNGWYSYAGNLDVVTDNVIKEATEWHMRFKKPIIMQEYGADTLEGLHTTPEFIWSEEYQVQLMSEHFRAFDYLRKKGGFFVGEFIWNFADFKTAQTYTRVGGNKKGIFTRNRQPKSSAIHLRKRYWELSSLLYNSVKPVDLYSYTTQHQAVLPHDEL